MYIKEIKLNSFKSFANTSNINLNETFTGIVGPNGSGKSNIVDAIKWVLGEQSVKTLRGSAGMTDVIFSGSKSRNASNSASVSITFDNTDNILPLNYNEVTIKRIVYRTGENEYYLNNEKCRLKDINDLFVDSLSSKESFNIIPQNKIEEILSEKAEDRRIIFEEAAGVLKYKKRKQEALKKLSKTHENIDRVDMIINELEVQIEPLEKASKKAIEYRNSKIELEKYEVALIIKDITQFNELFKNKKDIKESLQIELAHSSKENSEQYALIESKKLESTKLEENIIVIRKKISDLKEELSTLLSKKELTIERSKYDKDSNSVKINLLESKEKKLKLDNDIILIQEEINVLDDKSKLLLEELNKKTNSIKLINSEYQTEQLKYNNLKKHEFEMISKIDLLTSNLENMSKLPYSVKSVLDNPTLRGINNIVGNVISTKNEYSTMLEISLGASSNYIIVDNEICAKEAIDYLKNNSKGRATFFPISIIKPRSIEPNILSVVSTQKGYIGVCSDLVEYNSKYYNIVMNQLGNIIVVDNLDNAILISKSINHRHKVVTLDGELLNVGGSLTGGSIKKGNSYISDKYEIDKLNVLLEHVKNNINDSEIKIKNIEYNLNIEKENIMSLNVELANLKEQVNTKKNHMSSLKIEHTKLTNEIKDLSNNSSSVDKTIDKIMDNYYKAETECNRLGIELNSKEQLRRKILDEVIELESYLKKNINDLNSMNGKINSLEIEIVKISMALDNLLNRLNDEYSLTYEGAKEKYILEIDELEARNLVNSLKRTIKSLGNVNLDSIDEYERVNKRFTFLNKQKEDLFKSENDLLEIINNMDNVMSDKFEVMFNKINKEFGKVFNELFEGGEANLKLTDPSNMLETGIEINAIPPGKNMKSISLLSGGEKTLTAISLLFSIMNLKKVPFVILDEVESALDEINAEKFGEYLSNYRNKTQMLIITHKKKTMEYVDTLYGVTMQESGVSKLVSVKLEESK